MADEQTVQAPSVAEATQGTPAPAAQLPPATPAIPTMQAPTQAEATQGTPQAPPQLAGQPKPAEPTYKESWQHKLGGVFAGGSHDTTYKVNPDTGEIGIELKPKTGRQELMGAVANILSGMAAGAGQKNFQKGFAAGAQQVTQQLQQRQGQQKQDAVDNYNQAQVAKLRKAQLYRANIDNAMNTWQAEKNGTTDLLNGNYKTIYDNAVANDGVVVPDINQADAIAGAQDGKYKPGEMVFVPLKSVPKYDDEGNKTGEEVHGAIIKDVPYDFSKNSLNLDQLKSRGIVNSNLNPAKGATTSTAIVNSWIAKNTAVDQTFHEMNQVYQKIGATAPDTAEFFKNNPKAADAMQEFQQQLRGAGGDIVKALENMSKTKVDKDGNQIPNPDARFVPVLSQLFPSDVVQKYQEKTQAEKKAQEVGEAETARANAEANTPKGKTEAALRSQQLTNARLEGEEKRYKVDSAKIESETGKAINDPTRQNLTGNDFISTLPIGQQGSVKAAGEGRFLQTAQQLRTPQGQQFLGLVTRAFPDFDASKVDSYFKARENFSARGPVGVALNSGNTALKHLYELKKLNTIESRIPGTKDYNAYNNKLDTITGELAQFYALPKTDSSIGHMRSTLGAFVNRDAAIETQAQSMGDKFDSYESQWKDASPRPGIPMPQTHDAEVKKARAALDPNYAARIQGQNQPAPQVPVGATPIMRDGKTVGYIQNNQRTDF